MRDDDMIHKATLIISVLLFVGTISIVLYGYNHSVVFHDSRNEDYSIDFCYSDWHLEYVAHVWTGGNWPFPLRKSSWYWKRRATIHQGVWDVEIRFPVWAPLIVFACYPTIAFIRGPLRRHRRRKRNQCIHCGYNLTGLPEPRCPECGKEI